MRAFRDVQNIGWNTGEGCQGVCVGQTEREQFSCRDASDACEDGGQTQAVAEHCEAQSKRDAEDAGERGIQQLLKSICRALETLEGGEQSGLGGRRAVLRSLSRRSDLSGRRAMARRT